MGERLIISGVKHKRQYPQKAGELHGPKPSDIDSHESLERKNKKKPIPFDDRDRASSHRADCIFAEMLGVTPEVGMNLTDISQQGELLEITTIFPNGNIEVTQTSEKNGGNYSVKKKWTANEMRSIADADLERDQPRFSIFQLSEGDIQEIASLTQMSVDVAAVSSEGAVADVPELSLENAEASPVVSVELSEEQQGIIRPKPGTVTGGRYGGATPREGVSFGGDTNMPNDGNRKANVDVAVGDTPDNADTAEIDAQEPTGGRRRKNIQKPKGRKNTGQGIPPLSDSPLLDEPVSVIPQAPNEASEDNSTNTMKFESPSTVTPQKTEGDPSMVDILDKEKSINLVDQPDVLSQVGAQDEELVGFGRTYEEPAATVNNNGPENEKFQNGSVWVEEYLKEADQQADLEEALQREPAPAVVRTRNHPLHTENQKTQPRESDEEIGGLENARMAPPGSAEEAAVFAAFGRGPNGEVGGDAPEGGLRQRIERIDAATLACNQARLEYVMADNESRTVMSRLKGILGISGKGIQNEKVEEKKEAYQNKLRELRDLRLEMVKMRYADQTESQAKQTTQAGEFGSEPEGMRSESEEEKISAAEGKLLEKELEAELLHFAQEVNIGLYNAWTELKSEQKGLMGRLKQFGASYNKLSWGKKAMIGLPVVGLAFASGAGLLGTAMASAAIAAVIARRGVAAAGIFASVDGGLQKFAESRAQKMAEKIVAQGQKETQSPEAMAEDKPYEGGTVGSETQLSPEVDGESLDAKFERMKVFMDNHMIDSLDQTLESRVRRQDRSRLGALAGSMGAAFGLPSFMASETGHGLTRAATEKAGKVASSVAHKVFENDYSPKNTPTGGAGVGRETVQATTSSPDASTPSSVRSATGAALEQSAAAKGVDSMGSISGILGKEITLAKGDSVWKLAGNMAKELGVKGEAENLYFTDALKDAYLAKGGNPNIKAGAVFDWKKYLSAEDIQKALQAANSLSAEQKASVLANTEKNIVAAALTTEGPAPGVNEGSSLTEVAGVKSKNPDVLARARAQLAGTSSQTIPTGAGNGGRVQVPNMTTVTTAAGNYEISGVRPDQLVNTTGSPSATGPVSDSGITVEQAAPSQNALDAARRAGGGVEGFLKVADTAWGGETPTVDLIKIELVRPIVDKVPNMTCQEFFQVYLDAKESVSANYSQIDTLTFQGGLSWAEVDTFAHFINGFRDPNSGQNLIAQAVRANPNITLKEFVETYAPKVEVLPSSTNAVIGETSSTAEPTGPITVSNEAGGGTTASEVSTGESSPGGVASGELESEQPVVENGVSFDQGNNGEALAFSEYVEPSAEESFRQVSYEPSDNPPQRNGIVRGPAPRTGMPPAGGFESNPNIPGIGRINLMELQFAEQKLQVGPAAKLTLRQLAESAKDPSKIPSGLKPEDITQIKRLLARVPGTNTGTFILQNGNMPVKEFIRSNIRVRLPQAGGASI